MGYSRPRADRRGLRRWNAIRPDRSSFHFLRSNKSIKDSFLIGNSRSIVYHLNEHLILIRCGCSNDYVRRNLAVEYLLAGMALEEVSRLNGHSSVLITQKHYAPWVLERQQRLATSVRTAWSTMGMTAGTPVVNIADGRPARVVKRAARSKYTQASWAQIVAPFEFSAPRPAPGPAFLVGSILMSRLNQSQVIQKTQANCPRTAQRRSSSRPGERPIDGSPTLF
jgi:hypothetical protein